ncbi:MAG: hypothetical protein IJ744_02075 [Lachnospiraceae bacterium]|nr:hypothetical protein [Lachnospiraceae bacterium]
MSGKRKERKVLMVILAAMMAIELTALGVAFAILGGGTLQAQTMRRLNESDYYALQTDELVKETDAISERAGITGFSSRVTFESEDVTNEIREFTANRIKGSTEELKEDVLKEQLKADLYAFLEENQISKGRLDMSALDLYTMQVFRLYDQIVDNSFVNYYAGLRSRVSQICLIVILAMVFFLIVCILFIYGLVKMRRKTISYLIRALIAATVLIGGSSLYGYLSGWYQTIPVTPAFMAGFAKSYINGIFGAGMIVSGVYIVLIVICAIAMHVISQKKSK